MDTTESVQIMSAVTGTLRRLLYIGRLLNCFFFGWDKQTKQIVTLSSRFRHRMVQLCSILHLTIAICQTYYVAMSDNGVFNRTMFAACCSTSWITVLGRFEMEPNLMPIIRLNKLLSKSQQSQGKPTLPKFQLVKKIMVGIAFIGEATAYSLGLAGFVVAFIRQCAPPSLIGLSQLTSTPSQVSLTCKNPSSRLLTLCVETVATLHMGTAGVFYIGFEGLASVLFLVLSEYKFRLEVETENKRRRNSKQMLHSFRILQVEEKCVNSYSKGRIYPALISVAPIAQVVGTFVVISFHNIATWSDLLAPVAIGIAAFVANNAIHILSSLLFIDSRRHLQKLKRRAASGEERRLLRSMRTLRIEFGSNFVDAMTPIVVQDICMQQTVDLVLLHKTG